MDIEIVKVPVEYEIGNNEIEADIGTSRIVERDHSKLTNLDYEHSGHTGFQPAGDYATRSELPTKTSDLTNDNDFIDNTVNDLLNYELKTNTGSSIALSINSNTYVITLQLKNSSGTVLSQGEVDLPLETMVVNATYDKMTKEIVLTLQNGNTVRFSVADLVSGLVDETTFNTAINNINNQLANKLEQSDLEDYVKNTDYPTNKKGGAVKTYPYAGFEVYNGYPYAGTKAYSDYNSASNDLFVGKGTLENVIAGKELVNKTYVDNIVGNIETLLSEV